MMPLASQVPDNAPTINKISNAPVVDFKFSDTSFSIWLKEFFFKNPTMAATAAPRSKIN